MSLVDGLLVRTATITHWSQTGPEGADHLPTWVATNTTGVSVLVQPVEPREVTVGRETQIIELRAFFAAGTLIDGSDQFTTDGHTYEVVGPIEEHRDPFDGGVVDHIEADVREVTV